MRGKPPVVVAQVVVVGNIPAYAGKTVWDNVINPTWKEHPRVCGENPWSIERNYNVTGTSPRMRGKRRRGLLLAGLGRNIPAYAGKTFRALG